MPACSYARRVVQLELVSRHSPNSPVRMRRLGDCDFKIVRSDGDGDGDDAIIVKLDPTAEETWLTSPEPKSYHGADRA